MKPIEQIIAESRNVIDIVDLIYGLPPEAEIKIQSIQGDWVAVSCKDRMEDKPLADGTPLQLRVVYIEKEDDGHYYLSPLPKSIMQMGFGGEIKCESQEVAALVEFMTKHNVSFVSQLMLSVDGQTECESLDDQIARLKSRVLQ